MKVIVNGKEKIVKALDVHTLKEELKFLGKDVITIYNGFQTEENAVLKEKDQVSFIKKGVMPSKDELEALMVARHTPYVHEKVKKAKVAIAGLGGLGSNVAVALARTGVGHLHLVDFDIVEPSNLNRQAYKIKHLGMKKTEALKEEIKEINPYIEVVTDDIKITEENAVELFKGEEIVCEAFDKPEFKAILVNSLLSKRNDVKVVSASGLAGFESSNTIVTKKVIKNLYICGDGTNNAKIGRGLMAPRVTICAGHEANMILRLILEIEEV